MNPFGFVFASRYLGKDNRDFLKFIPQKEIYYLYCLENKTNQIEGFGEIPPHFSTVDFKISKITKKGEWTEETIFYETQYISLAYFSIWLELSVEEYIDIENVKSGFMPFKITNKHPIYKKIILNSSR